MSSRAAGVVCEFQAAVVSHQRQGVDVRCFDVALYIIVDHEETLFSRREERKGTYMSPWSLLEPLAVGVLISDLCTVLAQCG